MTSTLRIRATIDQDTLSFLADNGLDEQAAVETAERAVRAAYPTAEVNVETTTGMGRIDVRRETAAGALDYEAGDDAVESTVRDAIDRATEAALSAAEA